MYLKSFVVFNNGTILTLYFLEIKKIRVRCWPLVMQLSVVCRQTILFLTLFCAHLL